MDFQALHDHLRHKILGEILYAPFDNERCILQRTCCVMRSNEDRAAVECELDYASELRVC